jgi:hypothetical protein
MRHLLAVVALAICASVTLAGCTELPNVSGARSLDGMRKFPAIPWLDGNKNAYALASNRFGPTAKAREFVSELFRLGAAQVYVADPMDEESRIKLEGGPYADTLIVSLPRDKMARAALFKVFAAEARREGFSPEADRGQDQVLLWWD